MGQREPAVCDECEHTERRNVLWTKPWALAGADSVSPRISVGVAVATSAVPAQVLLAAADEAMYEAKRSGGNRHRIRYLPMPD